MLGLALSIGSIIWLDLRLVGLGLRQQSVGDLFRQIIPISLVGFGIMFSTGALLFWSAPVDLYQSIFFRLKALLLLLAGLNALVFQVTMHPTIGEWGKAPVPPRNVRIMGALSLVLWTSVIVFGRATAYNVFH